MLRNTKRQQKSIFFIVNCLEFKMSSVEKKMPGPTEEKFGVDMKNQLDVPFCKVVKTGWQVVRPWTHYLPTGLDNLPATTAYTNTRL